MQDISIDERKVIVFILMILIVGVGLSWLKKNNPVIFNEIGCLKNQQQEISTNGQTKITKKNDLIFINSADIDTLCKMPGVGMTIAQRIIDYRKENGRFETEQDLMKVKGISFKKMQKIKEYISLE